MQDVENFPEKTPLEDFPLFISACHNELWQPDKLCNWAHDKTHNRDVPVILTVNCSKLCKPQVKTNKRVPIHFKLTYEKGNDWCKFMHTVVSYIQYNAMFQYLKQTHVKESRTWGIFSISKKFTKLNYKKSTFYTSFNYMSAIKSILKHQVVFTGKTWLKEL